MRLLTVVLLFAFLNKPSNNIVLSPPAPLPWFIEHVALEPVDLPFGVSVSFVTDESGRLSNEYIVFRNTSSTALYVAGSPDDNDLKFDAISVEFPPGIGPMYKVVNGQAYKWHAKHVPSTDGYFHAWFKENRRDDSIWLYVFANQVRAETGTVLELKPLNQFGGDRPKDVKIPESQKVFLPTIYGKEEIQIPLMVSYTLNTEYRSYSYNNSPDSLTPEMIYCFILVIFVALVAGVLLVVKGIRNWIKEQTQKE